jgi:hypothetical protein
MKTEDQVKGRLLLDVVVRKGAAVPKLLSSKNKSLLVRGNAFLILDLGLDVVDSVRRLDIECDGLSGKGLDEDLDSSTETENQMESGLFWML